MLVAVYSARMNYRPTQFDINWTIALIDKMSDGGIWGIPRCQTVWRFDKTNKVLVCVYGDYDAPDSEALKIICPLIGWTTAHKPEPLTPEQVVAAMVPLTADMSGGGKTTSRVPDYHDLFLCSCLTAYVWLSRN